MYLSLWDSLVREGQDTEGIGNVSEGNESERRGPEAKHQLPRRAGAHSAGHGFHE